jgi:hypothetical protein
MSQHASSFGAICVETCGKVQTREISAIYPNIDVEFSVSIDCHLASCRI